jgi:hypothetical protein
MAAAFRARQFYEEVGDGMSRNALVTLLLIIVATLLAVALFVAGAIWRGRATAPPVAAAIKGSPWQPRARWR